MVDYIQKMGAYINAPVANTNTEGDDTEKSSGSLKARRVAKLTAALIGGFIVTVVPLTLKAVVTSPFTNCRNALNNITSYFKGENNSVIKKIAYLPYAIVKAIIQLPVHILMSVGTSFVDSLLVGSAWLTDAKSCQLYNNYQDYMAGRTGTEVIGNKATTLPDPKEAEKKDSSIEEEKPPKVKEESTEGKLEVNEKAPATAKPNAGNEAIDTPPSG